MTYEIPSFYVLNKVPLLLFYKFAPKPGLFVTSEDQLKFVGRKIFIQLDESTNIFVAAVLGLCQLNSQRQVLARVHHFPVIKFAMLLI